MSRTDQLRREGGRYIALLVVPNAYRIAGIVMLLIAAPALVGAFHKAFRFIADDYNEGWNAYFADRALNGGLYPGSDEMLINNYPPLSFYIVGGLGHLIGSNIVAGRILSILAFAAIASTIGVVVASRARSTNAGLFSAAYFAALFAVLPGGRLGMDDPQLLAHAIMTVGLAIILLSKPGTRTSFVAALVMLAAGLVKHNLLAAPLAVTLWQGFQGRRAFLSWLGAAFAAGAFAFLLLILLWGWTPLHEMMAPRGFSAAKLFRDTQKTILWLDVPLAVWVIQLALGRRDGAFLLASSYVASSLFILPLFFGGIGTNSNIAFDLVIALALATGLGLAQMPFEGLSRALVLVLALDIVVSIPGGTIAVFSGGTRSEDEVERATRSDVDYLVRHDGPALCENLSLCYWAKKPFVYDAFNMGQAFLAGARDERQLSSLMEAHAFSVIQLDAVTENVHDRFDSAFHQALDANYVLDRHDLNRFFFVPRTEGGGVPPKG